MYPMAIFGLANRTLIYFKQTFFSFSLTTFPMAKWSNNFQCSFDILNNFDKTFFDAFLEAKKIFEKFKDIL